MSLHHNNLTVIKGSSVKVIIQQVRDFFSYSIQKLPNIVGLVKLTEILGGKSLLLKVNLCVKLASD